MKKLFYLLVLSPLLLACQTSNIREIDQNAYRSTLDLLKQKQEQDFDMEYPFRLEVKLVPGTGKHQYEVKIDEFKYAVHKIQILILDPHAPKGSVAPNIGFTNGEEYHYIPNQYDEKYRYVRGISLNGQTTSEDLKLRIYVSFNKQSNDEKRTYFVKYEHQKKGSTETESRP